MFFISVDIDNYHDKCQIFISFKFKARFLHQSEKLSLIFLKINILIEKCISYFCMFLWVILFQIKKQVCVAW